MKIKLLAVRLTVATLIGLAVFLLSCLAAWRQAPEALMNNDMLDIWTRMGLSRIYSLIADRVQQGQAPPQSLRDLTPELEDLSRQIHGGILIRNGNLVDGWGRPFLYSAQGTSFTLKSYGRDGKPGGTGFDRDLDHSNDHEMLDYHSPTVMANPPMPTLHQFLFELPTGGMIWGCALSGALAFLLSVILVRPAPLTWPESVILVIKIGLTILATLFFAQIIMQIHIPSGH